MDEKKEDESIEEKNKRKRVGILLCILVVAMWLIIFLLLVFVTIPAMNPSVYSELCGTWEHNYIWSADNESYKIELVFYDDETYRMSDTNDLFGVECGRWYARPKEGLWSIYENAVTINFHSWLSFYTPHDTDTQAGIVTCKVGCEWVTMQECFLMIFPSGDKYEFINIDVQ